MHQWGVCILLQISRTFSSRKNWNCRAAEMDERWSACCTGWSWSSEPQLWSCMWHWYPESRCCSTDSLAHQWAPLTDPISKDKVESGQRRHSSYLPPTEDLWIYCTTLPHPPWSSHVHLQSSVEVTMVPMWSHNPCFCGWLISLNIETCSGFTLAVIHGRISLVHGQVIFHSVYGT